MAGWVYRGGGVIVEKLASNNKGQGCGAAGQGLFERLSRLAARCKKGGWAGGPLIMRAPGVKTRQGAGGLGLRVKRRRCTGLWTSQMSRGWLGRAGMRRDGGAGAERKCGQATEGACQEDGGERGVRSAPRGQVWGGIEEVVCRLVGLARCGGS